MKLDVGLPFQQDEMETFLEKIRVKFKLETFRIYNQQTIPIEKIDLMCLKPNKVGKQIIYICP